MRNSQCVMRNGGEGRGWKTNGQLCRTGQPHQNSNRTMKKQYNSPRNSIQVLAKRHNETYLQFCKADNDARRLGVLLSPQGFLSRQGSNDYFVVARSTPLRPWAYGDPAGTQCAMRTCLTLHVPTNTVNPFSLYQTARGRGRPRPRRCPWTYRDPAGRPRSRNNTRF